MTESKIAGTNGKDAKKLSVKLWAKGVVAKNTVFDGSENTQYYVRKSGQLMYGKLDFLNCAFGIVPPELDGYESTLDAPAFDINGIDSNFLLNRIIQKDFYKKNGDIANGSRKAKRIHPDVFLAMEFCVPEFLEQQKISTFLTLLDERISKQRELVENLKSYKRGLLSRIFRDNSKWTEYRIGDFLYSRNVKQVPDENTPLMAFIAYEGVAPKGDRYDRSFLVKDENKQYKRTEYNDFIYSSNNLDVGSIGLNQYGTAVISDVYEIFEISDKTVPTFISEAIKQPNIIHEILKYRQGVTYGQYRIYAEDFQSVNIKLPSFDMQMKFSSFFDSIDNKVEFESDLLKELICEKSALLQQMFMATPHN